MRISNKKHLLKIAVLAGCFSSSFLLAEAPAPPENQKKEIEKEVPKQPRTAMPDSYFKLRKKAIELIEKAKDTHAEELKENSKEFKEKIGRVEYTLTKERYNKVKPFLDKYIQDIDRKHKRLGVVRDSKFRDEPAVHEILIKYRGIQTKFDIKFDTSIQKIREHYISRLKVIETQLEEEGERSRANSLHLEGKRVDLSNRKFLAVLKVKAPFNLKELR